MPHVTWNPEVKLIIADVDETIADNYTPAVPEMITELSSLLREGKIIFMVTGASLARVRSRIVDAIPAELRRRILVAHCSGVEVWGFTITGELLNKPYYSLYESALTDEQKKTWREIVQKLIQEFHLKVFDPEPAIEFEKKAGSDPQSVMLEDRGPQITFEVVNGYNLTEVQEKSLEVSVPLTRGTYDLRIPILERAEQLLEEAGLPITPRLGGMWAIDLAIKGVNKTTAVKFVLESPDILPNLGVTHEDLSDPSHIEIWGDKFSVLTGTDRHMSEAVAPEVRSIDFREENPGEFLEGYNTVIWDGSKHLHNGLLEYLSGRPHTT